MPTISIIVPCYNEEKYIENCLNSLLNSTVDTNRTEIIFIDGGSSDRTVEIIGKYIKNNRDIKLLHNPYRHTPISMNMGITASTGEFIFIISAHAAYEAAYFTKLTDAIMDLNTDCVGGVLETDVKNKTGCSCAIKKVLTHKLGVGNASFRTGSNKIRQVDTVAFGCYRREVFKKIGLYNEQLIRNQDIELNKRIINAGGQIYLIPNVKATYYARETLKDLARNNYANGRWNVLTAYYTCSLRSLSLRHFIPLFFVLSLLLPLLFSLWEPKLLWLSILSLFSYLSLVIIVSLKLRDK